MGVIRVAYLQHHEELNILHKLSRSTKSTAQRIMDAVVVGDPADDPDNEPHICTNWRGSASLRVAWVKGYALNLHKVDRNTTSLSTGMLSLFE